MILLFRSTKKNSKNYVDRNNCYLDRLLINNFLKDSHTLCKGRLRATIFKSADTAHLIAPLNKHSNIKYAVSADLKMINRQISDNVHMMWIIQSYKIIISDQKNYSIQSQSQKISNLNSTTRYNSHIRIPANFKTFFYNSVAASARFACFGPLKF